MIRNLTNADILSLWERGASLHPLDQGLLILSVAFSEVPWEHLADWPLGRRNIALAKLHSACFGPILHGWHSCGCGEKLEFEMDARALVNAGGDAERVPSEPIVVKGYSFRLPTSRDLAWAARESDVRSAAICLLQSCRVDVGEPLEWSDADLDEVGQEMARVDPMAEIRVALRCPTCGSARDAALELATFLWTEIEGRARRLLLEIHAIASTYGWTEQEILSLSNGRRAVYFQMVQE